MGGLMITAEIMIYQKRLQFCAKAVWTLIDVFFHMKKGVMSLQLTSSGKGLFNAKRQCSIIRKPQCVPLY